MQIFQSLFFAFMSEAYNKGMFLKTEKGARGLCMLSNFFFCGSLSMYEESHRGHKVIDMFRGSMKKHAVYGLP